MSDVPDWAKQFMPLDAAEKAAEIRQENELKQLAEKFSKLADMSEQGAAPEIPSNLMVRCHDCGGTQIWKRTSASEIEVYHDCFSGKHSRDRIAALTLERDTLKAEIAQWKTWCIVEIAVRNPSVAEYMDHWEGRATKAEAKVERLNTRCPVCGGRDVISNGPYGYTCHHCADLGIIESLEAKVERLSAPVSEQEGLAYACCWADGPLFDATGIDLIVAARASTPPVHPINEDEQRRKDAAWNDRTKARCVCGEMIAWYSGEWLHVAGRSKSCEDGRLASPAHFLVGMPPA